MKKELVLNIEGDNIYLNKKLSILIKDSLMHIIQNSADHGIEKKGKIQLNLKENEDQINIWISDDGRGIDAEDIHRKALEKGLVINVTKEKIIRLLPPLISEEKHIIEIVDIIKQLINENYE